MLRRSSTVPHLDQLRPYIGVPRLLIPNSNVLPPLEFCFGTSPSQAITCRPFLKFLASPRVVTIALAVIGPMPGILASLRLFSFARCQATS